jgi:hypothetical protein
MAGLEVSHAGWDYRVERAGEAYQVRRRATGDTTGAYSAPQQVVLTTGSHHLQIF